MRSHSLQVLSGQKCKEQKEVEGSYISFPFALSLRYRWNKLKKLSISILNFYKQETVRKNNWGTMNIPLSGLEGQFRLISSIRFSLSRLLDCLSCCHN